MGLKSNNYYYTLGSLRYFGATVFNGAVSSVLLPTTHLTGAQRNFTAGEGCTNEYAGLPYGYRNGGSWSLPMKAGAVSSYNNVNGTGTITADLLAVKLAEAGLTGDGSITALGSLIVQAIASLTGSGTISDAQVNAFLAAVASLSGSGGVTDANLTGLGDAVAAIFGSGTAAGSTATGIAEAIAALTVTGTGLSTANVGQAVWAALAAANNTSGTMGEKLNDAGAAGNPWAALLAANNDPGTFGELVQLLETMLDAVKTKTDSLSFTVAGQVDSNVQSMNDAEVLGTGISTDLWRGE